MRSKNTRKRVMAILLIVSIFLTPMPLTALADDVANEQDAGQDIQENNLAGQDDGQEGLTIEQPVQITYTAEQYGGIPGETDSTDVLITLSDVVIEITAEHISVTGATRGSLRDYGVVGQNWMLGISDITVADGEYITIDITGGSTFEVTTLPQEVQVFRTVMPSAEENDTDTQNEGDAQEADPSDGEGNQDITLPEGGDNQNSGSLDSEDGQESEASDGEGVTSSEDDSDQDTDTPNSGEDQNNTPLDSEENPDTDSTDSGDDQITEQPDDENGAILDPQDMAIVMASSLLPLHNLSTDGPLVIPDGETMDITVTGSHTGSEPGITIEGSYSGTLTLDNVSIVLPQSYDTEEIVPLNAGIDVSYNTPSLALNMVGNNTIRGNSSYGISAFNTTVVVTGAGSTLDTSGVDAYSLTIDGALDITCDEYAIFAVKITVNAPLNITSNWDNIQARELYVNAPLNVTVSGGDGISITHNTANPIEINDNVTVISAGIGIDAYNGINLNNGTLTVTSTGGLHYRDYAHAIVWKDGAVNTMNPSSTVIATPGTRANGESGFALASYQTAPDPYGKGGGPGDEATFAIFRERNSLTDTFAEDFPSTINESGEVDPDDSYPESLLQGNYMPELIAVVPSSLITNPSDFIIARRDLDSSTISELAEEIIAKNLESGFASNATDLANHAIWLDLSLFDIINGVDISGDFRPEGVTVYLHFPPGRNASNSEFLIIHQPNGTAGSSYIVPYTLTPHGYKFTVYDFSPFAILYKDGSLDSGNSGSGESDPGGSDSGGSSSGGSSDSGSGNSGWSSSDTINSTPDSSSAPPPTRWDESDAIKELIGEAENSGENSIRTRGRGVYGIRKSALARLAGYSYSHDTVSDKAVKVRVTFTDPELIKDDTLVSGYVSGNDVNRVRDIFKKWFGNKLAVIHFDQAGSWGQTANIAAKVDLSGMDLQNLAFYSYDKKANKYTRILSPNYTIDAKGYVKFDTDLAGDIIISEGLFGGGSAVQATEQATVVATKKTSDNNTVALPDANDNPETGGWIDTDNPNTGGFYGYNGINVLPTLNETPILDEPSPILSEKTASIILLAFISLAILLPMIEMGISSRKKELALSVPATKSPTAQTQVARVARPPITKEQAMRMRALQAQATKARGNKH